MGDLVEQLRLLGDRASYEPHMYHAAADRIDALEVEIAELRRQLGGGCEANNGGYHHVITQGRYKFCGKCGETLTGVRYSHLPRTAPEPPK